MDALVDGQFPFAKLIPHCFVGLHQRQRQGKVVVLHGPHQILALGIAQQQDQDTVQFLGVVAGGEGLNLGPVSRRAGEYKLRRTGQRVQDRLYIAGLMFNKAWEQGFVPFQHQSQDPQTGF